LCRTDGLERDELRGTNGWQLWRRDDVECRYKHLYCFHGRQLRRTDGLGWNILRGLDRLRSHCSKQLLCIRGGGQLRRTDGLGWNILRGLDHLRSHCSKQLLRIRRSGQLRRADGLGRNILRGLDHLRSHRGK